MKINSITPSAASVTFDDGTTKDVDLDEIRRKIIADEDRDGKAEEVLREVIRFRLKEIRK